VTGTTNTNKLQPNKVIVTHELWINAYLVNGGVHGGGSLRIQKERLTGRVEIHNSGKDFGFQEFPGSVFRFRNGNEIGSKENASNACKAKREETDRISN